MPWCLLFLIQLLLQFLEAPQHLSNKSCPLWPATSSPTKGFLFLLFLLKMMEVIDGWRDTRYSHPTSTEKQTSKRTRSLCTWDCLPLKTQWQPNCHWSTSCRNPLIQHVLEVGSSAIIPSTNAYSAPTQSQVLHLELWTWHWTIQTCPGPQWGLGCPKGSSRKCLGQQQRSAKNRRIKKKYQKQFDILFKKLSFLEKPEFCCAFYIPFLIACCFCSESHAGGVSIIFFFSFLISFFYFNCVLICRK